MIFLYDGKLNDLDLTIAKQIEADPHLILDNNIFEAAEILGVSASKLTKYCQKVQLKGFKEIKFRVNQELNDSLYIEQSKDTIDIKSIINSEYHNRIPDLELLISNCSKIVLISDSNSQALATFATSELRRGLGIDVVNYTNMQDFSFEYFTDNTLTIFVDQPGTLELTSSMWYRVGNKYLHLTEQELLPAKNYYPINLDNSQLNFSYSIKLVMIIAWIIHKKKECNLL